MKLFNGTISLIGGIIGMLLLFNAIYNDNFSWGLGFLSGALILMGVIATVQKVRGDGGEKPSGPLSSKKKK